LTLEHHPFLLLLALALDAAIGDPDWLWRRLPHPVALIGKLIAVLEKKLNKPDFPRAWKKEFGAFTLAVVVALAALFGFIIEAVFARIPYGWIGTALVAAILLAGRSLYDHVAGVATAFETGGLAAARKEIAKIVGRDPETLDEGAVSRAAIESTAENFSDGLIAPAFWFALLGLPGIFAYKAINTADSMIGHRSERYRDFGWAAAKLDDLVNWPAARLSGLLIALAAPFAHGSVATALRVMLADAGKHRSPNGGWPESAIAGALGVALLGPRTYDGRLADDPFLNTAGRPARPADIRRALHVYLGAGLLFAILVLWLGIAVSVV
jgi:adenosylcobinamide-phosphate synthase